MIIPEDIIYNSVNADEYRDFFNAMNAGIRRLATTRGTAVEQGNNTVFTFTHKDAKYRYVDNGYGNDWFELQISTERYPFPLGLNPDFLAGDSYGWITVYKAKEGATDDVITRNLNGDWLEYVQ